MIGSVRKAVTLLLVAVWFAGCTAELPEPTSSESAPAPTTKATATTPKSTASTTDAKTGIVVEVIHSPAGEGEHVLDVEARNEGDESVNISSICHPVFEHEVKQGNKRVWPEGQAYCMAYGVKPFAPGESVNARFYWNETTWDESTGKESNAGPGTYAWNGIFYYQEGEAGFINRTATVTVTIE